MDLLHLSNTINLLDCKLLEFVSTKQGGRKAWFKTIRASFFLAFAKFVGEKVTANFAGEKAAAKFAD